MLIGAEDKVFRRNHTLALCVGVEIRPVAAVCFFPNPQRCRSGVCGTGEVARRSCGASLPVRLSGSRYGLLGRSNVLIYSKEVVGIVLSLDVRQTIVVVSIGGANTILTLFHHEVYVGAPG